MKFKKLLNLFMACFLLGSTNGHAQVLLSESFDATTFPPTGWTTVINGGAYDWQRVVSQSTAPYIYPSINTHTGAGMACYKSFSVPTGGAEMRTPSVNLVYPTGMNQVTFWMYRDPDYTSSNDRVEVYANTTATATGGTLLGTINRYQGFTPVVPSTGWYEYSFIIPASFNTATNYIVFKAISAWGNDMFIDDVSILHIPPCTGMPTGGTTVATPSTVCPATPSNLTLSGSSINSGLAYQWQDSVAPGTWQNIATATSSSFTTPGLTAPRYYRSRVICTATNDTAYSIPVKVNVYTTTLPYLETFESIVNDNDLPNCLSATSIGNSEYTYTAPTGYNNQINHTPGGSKYGSFYWLYSPNAFFTPAFNLTAGTTYEFSFWYITDGYGGWTSLEAFFGTSPNVASMTNLIGAVTPAPVTNTTYKRFVGTFTPTTTGIYYMGVVCNHTTQPNYLTIDDIGVVELPACSGQPNGGAVVAVPASPCPGSATDLTLNAAATYAAGIDYQWQQAPIATGPYTNVVGGTGATTRYYTTVPINATTFYRARLICTNGGPDTAYSSPFQVSPVVTTLPYTETFESIANNDQLPGCLSATNLGTNTRTYTSTFTGNQTNHTPGGSKFGLFYYYPAGTDAFFTPGVTLQAGRSYLFTFWYVGYANSSAPFTSLEVFYGTSPNVASMTVPVGTSVVPNNTTYQQYSEAFTPTTTGLYYVGILANHTTSGNNYYVSIDDIGLVELIPCTGKPDAGTINPVTPCPNTPFTLTVNGGSLPNVIGNLNFLWEDSTAGGSWLPTLGISTNQSLIVNTGVNTTTYYRRIISCTNSNMADTTPVYAVVPAPFINCYCTPVYSNGSSTNIITNVKLLTLNNTSSGSSPWYVSYTAQQPAPIAIPTLTMGTTDTLSITHSSNATNYSGVWIDFNHSATFQANEFFTLSTNAGANGIARIPITPPLNSLPGLTRMRIRAGDQNAVTSNMPCGNTTSGYGEAEDYLVNIQYPLCSGPTEAGRAIATDTAICIGYEVDIYDTTHEYRRSQISWSWENSTDGGFTWNAVPNSQNKDTLLNILINAAVKYRLKMMCNVTGDSSYSVPVNIRIKQPYECYCYSQSNGGPTDTSDIGAVVISSMVNATGGPHVLNPTAIRRRTDYTSIPNIYLNTYGKYRLSIYHTQRNKVHADALVTVFLDFNNDLQYDVAATPNSERVFQGISSAANFYIDTSITIPNAVIPDVPTGMRVILNNDLNPNSPANMGCGPYVSGETEDYTVIFKRAAQGVGGVTNLEHVSLYPNPTTGKFTVMVGAQKSMDNVEVIVSTIAGKSLLRKSYSHIGTRFSDELDLSEVARGIYFVEVRTAGGDKMVQKLVIR